MNNIVSIEKVVPTQQFSSLPDDQQIRRTARALEAHGIRTLIAANAREARRMFFELVPEGAEVFLGAAVTLEQAGIKDEIDNSGRFDALRPRIFGMDRATQGQEIRKLGAAPDYAAGSVHAVTENGNVIIASKSGSQLGPYVSGAGRVIWVVGAQKLVKDLDEALRRLQEHSLPLEQVNARQRYNMETGLDKILIINGEFRPDRITMIIVKEKIGY